MGQPLSKHMKTCKGFTRKATDMVTTENKGGMVTSSSKDGITTSSGKKKKKKHKTKDLPSDSQPPPQSSQVSSQVSSKSWALAARVPVGRRRNAPPATNTTAWASLARTNPARTSNTARTSLAWISQPRRRSKTASLNVGDALTASSV